MGVWFGSAVSDTKMAAAAVVTPLGGGGGFVSPIYTSRYVTRIDSKPVVIVVEDTDEGHDMGYQAKLWLTSILLPALPPIVQQRINRAMLVQRSSAAAIPPGSEDEHLPIGILPVSPNAQNTESANGMINCLVVHGRPRCSLNELSASHQSNDLMSWLHEQPLYGPLSPATGAMAGIYGGAAADGAGAGAAAAAAGVGGAGADLHVVAQPHMHQIGDAALFRANAPAVEVIVNHRSADGLLLRSATLVVLNNLTGLQLKSKVISAFNLPGGFQHFLMSVDGHSFGSRVPIFTHTSFREGCVVEIEDIGDRAKPSGRT